MFYEHHFIGMHWIWWIVMTGVILLLVFNVFPYRPGSDTRETALEILEKRFAKGEIEREEFEERRSILEESR